MKTPVATRVNAHLQRLKAAGGQRTSVEMSAETLAHVEEIRARGKFTTTREIVAEAIRRLARK